MEFEKSGDGKIMNVSFSGEINSLNIIGIEKTLLHEVETVEDLTIDLKELEYTSSAGLRLFHRLQKIMKNKGGNMVIKNVCDDVLDILKVAGFLKILNIEM